jgi:hypothetical protein
VHLCAHGCLGTACIECIPAMRVTCTGTSFGATSCHFVGAVGDSPLSVCCCCTVSRYTSAQKLQNTAIILLLACKSLTTTDIDRVDVPECVRLSNSDSYCAQTALFGVYLSHVGSTLPRVCTAHNVCVGRTAHGDMHARDVVAEPSHSRLIQALKRADARV